MAQRVMLLVVRSYGLAGVVRASDAKHARAQPASAPAARIPARRASLAVNKRHSCTSDVFLVPAA